MSESMRVAPWMAKLEFLRFKCARCGKEVYKHGEDWGWRYHGENCCSYTCMRAMEKAEEQKKPWKRVKVDAEAQYKEEKRPGFVRPKMAPEKEARIAEMVLAHTPYKRIAKEMHVALSTVSKIARENGVVKRPRSMGRR